VSEMKKEATCVVSILKTLKNGLKSSLWVISGVWVKSGELDGK
jgi:hypothetical protein